MIRMIHEKRSLVFLVILYGCFLNPTSGLVAQSYRFNHLSLKDGLSQVTVNAIYQDSQGYMWFGTQDGLNRYNGYEFIHYRSEPGNENSLTHSWIWDIFEDTDQNLWVATWDGLNRLSPDRSKIQRYYTRTDVRGSIRGERPVSISESASGKLWIGTWGGGLNVYRPETDSFRCFSSTIIQGEDLPGDFVRKILIDSGDRLWIGTWAGLWVATELDREVPEFRYINLGHERSRSDFKITGIMEDRGGNIWITTLGEGVYQLSASGEIIKNYRYTGKENELVSNQLSGILQDSKGNIWIGTVSMGIDLLKRGSSAFIHLVNDPEDEESIAGNNINSLFMDQSGLIWAGTKGLSFYNPSQNQFNSYNDFRLASRKMDEIRDISAIKQDDRNRIWLGTAGSGIFCLNRDMPLKEKQWLAETFETLKGLNISSITADLEQNIWFGTRGNGLIKINPEKQELVNVVQYSSNQNTYGLNYANSIAFIPPSSLWVATYENGLILYDIRDKSYRKFLHDESDPASFPANYLLRIFRDSQDKLWICSWGAGIIYMDPVLQTWTAYSNDPDDASSLSDNIPHTVWESDRNGKRKIWIGTRKGISCLDMNQEGSGGFRNYYPSDGLPGNVINSILGDGSGTLWVSTNSGLCKFNPDSLTFRNYEEKDGLQGNEFNAGAGEVLADGRLAFGGVNGFNIFYPDSIRESNYQPRIVIQSFRVFDEEFPVDPRKMSIKLGYKENFISFEFSALDFSQPHKIKYRYMMEGIDRDWVKSDRRRFASYTDLKPGDYRFLVSGTNSDGIWSDRVAEFKVSITPPYWQRWWFRVLILLVVIGMIYLFMSYRINKIREIERLRVRIASDLHDDIGSSLTHITIHSQLVGEKVNDEKARNSLERIGEISRDVISTMSDIVWSIDARNDNLKDMLDRMRDYAFNSLTEKDIEVSFDAREMDKNKKMDVLFRQNIFSIYKESINNIIKHSGANKVSIVLDNSGTQFMMKICDNGKGFDENSIRKGNGLRNMKMRAGRLGGKIEIHIKSGTCIELFTRSL